MTSTTLKKVDPEENLAKIVRTRYHAAKFRHEQGSIFTRRVVEDINKQAKQVVGMLNLGIKDLSGIDMKYDTNVGKPYRTWRGDGEGVYDEVEVCCLARVELIYDFQIKFRDQHLRFPDLFKMNPDEKHLFAPFYLKPQRVGANVPRSENFNQFTDVATRSEKCLNLWRRSQTEKGIQDTMDRVAMNFDCIIYKIVGIGIGALHSKPSFFGHAILQHFTIFAMAEKLYKSNKKVAERRGQKSIGKAKDVDVFLEDVLYRVDDHCLLKQLAREWNLDYDIHFTKYFQALLEVDANTLVISAFLPYHVPMMQILADMFFYTPDEGPKMIITDLNDEEQETYSLSDRQSPRVLKWLKDNYQKLTTPNQSFRGHKKLEQELEKETNPNGDQTYWLPKMDFWVRKDKSTAGAPGSQGGNMPTA